MPTVNANLNSAGGMRRSHFKKRPLTEPVVRLYLSVVDHSSKVAPDTQYSYFI